MPSSPKLLFLTPTWPRPSGTGLSMRCWAVAEALGRRYSVTVAVLQADGLPPPRVLPSGCAAVDPSPPPASTRLRRLIQGRWPALGWTIFRQPQEWPGPVVPSLDVAPAEFDAVHVFRLYVAPCAAAFLGRVPCALDLDEGESRVRLRLAELHRQRGHHKRATMMEAEARFFEREEQRWLPSFDRSYVSSDLELRHLAGRGVSSRTVVVPNTVPVPAQPSPQASLSGQRANLLFVGNLNYFPNEDGVRYFASEVLPMLLRARPELRVQVVGNVQPRLLESLSRIPGMDCLGFAADLVSLYRDAHLVIAPIRAGGGTRIKILEAFSHCRAVVSTPEGAEGIEAVNGRHLLAAATAGEFAASCLRLLGSPQLRAQVAEAGYRLAVEKYSPGVLDGLLR